MRIGAALGHVAMLSCATLLAPLAAAPAGLATLSLVDGDLSGALIVVALSPILMLTLPGVYAYALAFTPVLVLGTGLSIVADAYPVMRRKRIWALVGAMFGIPMGLLFPVTTDSILACAAAGAACAFIYRIILGRTPKWGDDEALDPEIGMA